MGLMEEARTIVRPMAIGDARSFNRVAKLVGQGIKLTAGDWVNIGREYYSFSKNFPRILQSLIERLDPEGPYAEVRRSLTEILREEEGTVPHADMFRKFIEAAGASEAVQAPQEPRHASTQELIEGLAAMYSGSSSVEAAFGAQTAFELVGEEIIRCFSIVAFRGSDVERAHLRYFDEHLIAEANHVSAMDQVAEAIECDGVEAESTPPPGRPFASTLTKRDAFLRGAAEASRLLHEFWAELWEPVLAEHFEGKLLFLSWSGLAARQVAERLPQCLARHIPAIEVSDFFFSDTDIRSGDRWTDVLDREVRRAKAALVVLSPHSVRSAWLNFEAGALYHSEPVRRENQLHVLVLGKDDVLGADHPLHRFQRVGRTQIRSFVEKLAELAQDRRPRAKSYTEAQLVAAEKEIRDELHDWMLEADREEKRRPEKAILWLQYLLSLTSRDIKSVKIPDAPNGLSSFRDVAEVLNLLVRRYMGPRIEPGTRVYVATRLDIGSVENTGRRYHYRILYSAAGADAEDTWLEGSLVGRRSAIHECFETRRKSGRGKNAKVEGEDAVHCRPVTLGNEVLCVVALSSRRADPTDALVETCEEFECLLQWFFSIVGTRLRWGKIAPIEQLQLLPKTLAITPDSSDAAVGAALEEQLRFVDRTRSFAAHGGPLERYEIKSSIEEHPS